MIPGHTNESDGFAIAMLIAMACSFGVMALIVITILRNAAKRNHEVEELMDDFEREQKKPKKATIGAKKEPWERDADWWKK